MGKSTPAPAAKLLTAADSLPPPCVAAGARLQAGLEARRARYGSNRVKGAREATFWELAWDALQVRLRWPGYKGCLRLGKVL